MWPSSASSALYSSLECLMYFGVGRPLVVWVSPAITRNITRSTGICTSSGQTPRKGVDLVFLVERHHRLVERLAVALVLGLQLLELGLEPLHGQHRAGALDVNGASTSITVSVSRVMRQAVARGSVP